MANNAPVAESKDWFAVIGKSLAYLCLQEAQRKDPKKFDSVLKQVKFLQKLGLSRKDAAEASGSSPHSVNVLHSRHKSKRAKHGTKKRKVSARR